MKVKDIETTTRNYARKSLMTFLEGEKNLNWIAGVIRSSRVKGERLKEIFDRLEDYGDKSRFQDIKRECKDQGLL